MKNQALFSSKDKSKKLKCCLLQFLFGALRVKTFLEGSFGEFISAKVHQIARGFLTKVNLVISNKAFSTPKQI